MDVIREIAQIANSFSFLIFIVIGLPLLAKFGVLDKLWKKNGNGKNEVLDLLKKLEGNDFKHTSGDLGEIKDALNRIERRLEKLDEIAEGMIYLKARINGRQ